MSSLFLFEIFGAKLLKIMHNTKRFAHFLSETTKAAQDSTHAASFVLMLSPRIIFRGARRIRSTSCGLWRGVKPVRDDHSSLPCARGNHACSRGGGCGAEMFFSLSYRFIFVVYSCVFQFGLQNYTFFFNRQKNLQKNFIKSRFFYFFRAFLARDS